MHICQVTYTEDQVVEDDEEAPAEEGAPKNATIEEDAKGEAAAAGKRRTRNVNRLPYPVRM